MDRDYLRIAGIIVTLVFVALLGGFLFMDSREARRQAARIEALKEEALPYEREIAGIRKNMEKMRQEAASGDGNPQVTLCFRVRSAEDIAWAEAMLSPYSFPISMVVDAEATEETRQEILNGIDGADVMASGDPSLENEITQAQIWKKQAREKSVPFSEMWFLEEGTYTKENVEILKQNGYQGFTQMTDYRLNLASGVWENGLFYMEYVPVKEGDNKIDSTLRMVANQKKPAVLSFDVEELKRLEKAQELVVSVLDSLQEYAENDLLQVCGARDSMDRMKLKNVEEAARQKAYEEYEKEQQERIEELQRKIAEIYEGWKAE